MIESIVFWALHESELKQSLAALSVSNLIVICYFVAYLLNRKAVFITVFFITELTLVDMIALKRIYWQDALGIRGAANDKHEVVNSGNFVVISVYLMKFYPFVGVLVILTQT